MATAYCGHRYLGCRLAIVRFGPSVFTDESQPRSAQIIGLVAPHALSVARFLGNRLAGACGI